MSFKNIYQQLEKIAFQKTIPFCYSCYKVAPTGTCNTCMSDVLMRLLPDYGCEYGTDWVIRKLIRENLTPANIDDNFEEMIEDCYGETVTVGFMELSTVDVMKSSDPVSWDISKYEYVDGLVEDDELITFDNGSSYYWITDVENYIEEEIEEEEAS